MTAETVTRNTKCPCRKKKCERHGDCDACRAHHAGKKDIRHVRDIKPSDKDWQE